MEDIIQFAWLIGISVGSVLGFAVVFFVLFIIWEIAWGAYFAVAAKWYGWSKHEKFERKMARLDRMRWGKNYSRG
jgi:hypothetical protein